MNNKTAFGTRLRELRKKAGLSLRELAVKVYVDFTYLSKIENGILPPPSEKVILHLADSLGADKDDLLILAGKIPSDITAILKNRGTIKRLRAEQIKKGAKPMNLKLPTLLKVPINIKNQYRLALPLLLVMAIVILMFLAPPALAVTITVTPSTGAVTLGGTYSFTVQVDVNNTDYLPIQSVDLQIYNGSVSDIYTNLPLSTLSSASYTGSAGSAIISATAGTNWGYGYAPAGSSLLGTADSFAVLGALAVTDAGSSVLTGDLGISPNGASSITGFPPGTYTGTLYAADSVALQAQNDVTTAYIALAGQAVDVDLTGQDLGGLTLTPGVYHFDTSAQLTGTLTLNAQNDPDSVFVFQIGSTLTTAAGSSVVVINAPPNWCNKYWQVGSSATLGANSAFVGNILALTSITMNSGASLSGRALARNGSVTLDSNTITVPACAGSRYGYGYGYSGSYGYAYGYGYGYGYGSGSYIGTTSITYSIVWTPPSNWQAGTYNIKVIAYTSTGDTNNAFINATAATVSLVATSPEGGGGGEVIPTPTPTPTPCPPETPCQPTATVDVSSIVNSQGVFTQSVTATSADSLVNLVIGSGTVGKTAGGLPLTQITIAPMTTPPTPPTGANVIGLMYDFGPAGATFNPPISMTFQYDPAAIPSGVSETNLVLAYYDSSTGRWVTLTSVVNPVNNTITVQVSHFTPFAILYIPAAATPTPAPTPQPTTSAPTTLAPTPKPTTSAPTTLAPTVAPTTTPKPGAGTNWWLWGSIIIVVLIIAVGAVIIIRRRK